MTDREALIALNMLPKVGPVRVRRLLERFGNPQSILGAPESKTRAVNGVGPEMARILHRWEDHADLAAELASAADRGINIITAADAVWPDPLCEMPDAPLLLYVWGDLLERDRHAIALVGSRRTTHYGRDCTKKLSFQIAHAGFTVISGLARGIDTTAHEGALAADGRTVAVLGSGLAQLYPPENLPLAEKIADGHGAVVTEFPLHQPPDKQTFPQRNRIVAGWCAGLVVVECAARSGALITANLAGEYGRQVFAVPGPIDRPSSAGCNELIRTGATLITDGAQVLEDLDHLPLAPPTRPDLYSPIPETDPASLNSEEEAVLAQLDGQERSIDEIITAAGLPASTVSVTLLRLEMKRLAKQLPGSYFVKTT
ncbi:MAG: DNA-protecting protein DprA [Akkermansiaceae bacterium]|nr:DNA-protecting protein DprA [Akkermansiaceae bacterium]